MKDECQPIPSQISCKYSSSSVLEKSFNYANSGGAPCAVQEARRACLKHFSSNINVPQGARMGSE